MYGRVAGYSSLGRGSEYSLPRNPANKTISEETDSSAPCTPSAVVVVVGCPTYRHVIHLGVDNRVGYARLRGRDFFWFRKGWLSLVASICLLAVARIVAVFTAVKTGSLLLLGAFRTSVRDVQFHESAVYFPRCAASAACGAGVSNAPLRSVSVSAPSSYAGCSTVLTLLLAAPCEDPIVDTDR